MEAVAQGGNTWPFKSNLDHIFVLKIAVGTKVMSCSAGFSSNSLPLLSLG